MNRNAQHRAPTPGDPFKEWELRLESRLTELPKLRSFVQRFCEVAPPPPPDSRAVQNMLLAVTEVTSNIIRHGYGEAQAGDPIEVLASRREDRIDIRICDWARNTFHPEAEAFDRPAGDEEGLPPVECMGLFLIKSCVDQVEYFCDEADRKNCVRLTIQTKGAD